MDDVLVKYDKLMEILDEKQKRRIHYKSLRNFIIHLNELESIGYKYNIERKIDEYLELVEQNINDIDKTFIVHLFADYIVPTGEVYKKIGFKEITQLRYSIFYTLPIDCVVGILLLKFPYPILTVLLLINHFFRQRKYYKANMVYGMFY